MSSLDLSESGIRNQIELPDSVDQDKLREIMIYRGLGYTQEEVATEVGVSQRTVSRYLNEVKSIATQTDSPAKAVFYGLFISMFSDKLTEVMALMLELTEQE